MSTIGNKTTEGYGMYRLGLLAILLTLTLTACFRDANQRDDATSVPINQFLNENPQASPSPPPNTPIATLTATPELEPTNTFPVGGPPVDSDTEDETQEPEADAGGAQPPLPPTVAIPSFTPSAGNFGDSGITPTSSLPTQPVPDAFVTPTAPPDETPECVYVVQAGDTLFSIATANGVTAQDFTAANPALAANPNALSIGQELQIPGCQPTSQQSATEEAPPVAEDTQPQDDPPSGDEPLVLTHVVAQGDTLFSIANFYGVSVDALIAANPALAANPNALSIGQELAIPPLEP